MNSIRFVYAVVFACSAVFLIGCGDPKEKPIWEDVKITDLTPVKGNKQQMQLKTTSFDVHIFEMPAKNINMLDEIWQILYTQPLRFNDPDAFAANSFSAGYAQPQTWNLVAKLLLAGKTKKIEAVSILLTNGEPDDINIEAINEQTIFYASNTGLMNGVTVGPGTLALRIKADRIFTLKGVRNITVTPTFSPYMANPIAKLANRDKTEEFLFSHCAFQWKASPGDFVILGPTKYIDNKITLAGSFFSKPEGSWAFIKTEPIIRIFMLVCTRIVD